MQHQTSSVSKSGSALKGRTRTIDVRPALSRRDRDAFVRFPWRLYADDPQWVPPLLMERKEFIHPRKHPFYKHGAAVPMLAWCGDEVVGRVLVSDDPLYNQEHGTNLGCFGMFESIDDSAVAQSLVESAESWLSARGRTEIMGPIDYSTNYACGLLVEGFETPPRIMMNHNPPHYARLLESTGLSKAKDLYSWWFADSLDMLAKWRRRAERLVERAQITVRPFRKNDLEAEVERCKQVYNEAWERNWGFVKMTDAEFRHLAHSLKLLAVPELLLLAEVDGRPVGFSMTLPDINEAIKPLDGRLFPLGLFKLRRNCRRIKTARMLTFGVVEGFRRRGISELMIIRTLDYGKNTVGYTGAELGWTLEDNDLINRTIEAVGGHRYKTYRIYQKSIA